MTKRQDEPAEGGSVTEIDVTGANCAWCLHDTLGVLRAEPGVVAVGATIARQRLWVQHEGLPSDHLLAVVREHLHADVAYATERVMAQIDPQVASAPDPCPRCHRSPDGP